MIIVFTIGALTLYHSIFEEAKKLTSDCGRRPVKGVNSFWPVFWSMGIWLLSNCNRFFSFNLIAYCNNLSWTGLVVSMTIFLIMAFLLIAGLNVTLHPQAWNSSCADLYLAILCFITLKWNWFLSWASQKACGTISISIWCQKGYFLK